MEFYGSTVWFRLFENWNWGIECSIRTNFRKWRFRLQFFFVIFEFWILIGFEYQKFEFPNLNDFFFGIGIEVGSFHPILKRISQFWVSVLVFEQLRSGTVAGEADRSSHLQ